MERMDVCDSHIKYNKMEIEPLENLQLEMNSATLIFPLIFAVAILLCTYTHTRPHKETKGKLRWYFTNNNDDDSICECE